jgi:hypothetical protein
MFKYFFNATLNYGVLFARLLRVGGRLLNILIPKYYALENIRGLVFMPSDKHSIYHNRKNIENQKLIYYYIRETQIMQ